MDKNTKKSKDAVLKSIKEAIDKIFNASKDAEQIVYESCTGKEYRECPGAYNSAMTQAMAGDMMQLSPFMHSKDNEMAKAVKTAADYVRECDIALRRMFDDRNDNRPVAEFPAHRIDTVIETMCKLKKSEYLTCPIIEHYAKKMDMWVEKAAKMTIWAFYCESMEKIDSALRQADMRAYDDDGNQIYGISEKDAEAVKIIAEMEKIMLQALVRIPFEKKECHDCVDKIELINILINSIANEDTEKLDYLAKCAEAAKEFTETQA